MATAPNLTNVQAQTGNRVAVMFGGIQIGAMQSIRMSQDYGHEGVYGIGDMEAIEHVPGAARYSLSASQVVLKRSSMKKAGIAMENASDVLKGIVFDVEVFSKDDGTSLQKYQGCSFVSGDSEVSRNSIIMSSAQFMALTVSGVGL